MNVISVIIAIIFIAGLLTLALCWGKLFTIGLRSLLPIKIERLKNEGLYCFLAFIFSLFSLCATVSTTVGVITITKLIFFN